MQCLAYTERLCVLTRSMTASCLYWNKEAETARSCTVTHVSEMTMAVTQAVDLGVGGARTVPCGCCIWAVWTSAHSSWKSCRVLPPRREEV